MAPDEQMAETALLEQARRIREAPDRLLEDTALCEPLSEDEYWQAAFNARRQGGPAAARALRHAQQAAQARAAARRASFTPK